MILIQVNEPSSTFYEYIHIMSSVHAEEIPKVRPTTKNIRKSDKNRFLNI
jgi:hypothetical protein